MPAKRPRASKKKKSGAPLSATESYEKALALWTRKPREALAVIDDAVAEGVLERRSTQLDREMARKLASLRWQVLKSAGGRSEAVKDAFALSRSLGLPALVRYLPPEGWAAKFGADAYSMHLMAVLALLRAGKDDAARLGLAPLRATFLADDNREAMEEVKRRLETFAAEHPARRDVALELAARFASR